MPIMGYYPQMRGTDPKGCIVSWILVTLLGMIVWIAIGGAVALLVGAASKVGSNPGSRTRDWTSTISSASK